MPLGDYPVGYCRPPKDGQIKPGEKRNPNGRPRKQKVREMLMPEALLKLAIDELLRPVTFIDQGRQVTVPTIQAIHRQRCHQALKGKPGAIKEALADAERLAAIASTTKQATEVPDMTDMDAEQAKDAYFAMLRGAPWPRTGSKS